MRKGIHKQLYRLLLFGSSLLLLAASCHSDDEISSMDDQASEHTTLRCKINGEDWTPAGGDLFSIYPFDLQYYSDTGVLNLDAQRNIGNVSQSINIATRIRNLNEDNNLFYAINLFTNGELENTCKRFALDTLSGHHLVVIELDTIDYSMIGEFAFTAINECNDTVKITEGYFDLKYRF